MNQRILNVDNGPGSNGLRGGIKQYSPKTTTGQWLDTYGGPMGYARGFTSADFQTEAQHAQLGAIGKPRGEFGVEIPIVDTRDARGNSLNSTGTETWVSNTKATHPNFGTVKTDNTFKLLQPRLSREQLLAYRKQWTCDNEQNRKIRFQTESRIAGNAVGSKFATNALRTLPGTPRSMEEYRQRLVEKFGIFSLCAMRLQIGTDGMSCNEFRARIQEFGVPIKPYELSQVLAYISPSTAELSAKEVENFLLLLKGHTGGFSAQAVSSVFFTLCNTSAEDTTLPLRSLLSAIDADNHHEVAEGYAKFLPAYIGQRADEVTLHQFLEMHDDMYASSPAAFQTMMDAVWKL